LTMLLALPCVLSAGAVWTEARDLLARLFSPAETCELGEEVVGGRVEPGARTVVVPVRKKAWEASLGGEEAAKPYIKARLAGWPARLLADRDALPRTDAEFVARLARDTWRGLEAFTDREHQLPVDNVRLGAAAAGRDEARVGDYTNVTSIGLRLIAIVAAHELGLATEREAVGRLRALLDTLGRLETHDGFFFNYYDTTSLERTSNFISFVDSSWLTAGLMVVRTAFPELHDECTRLIERADYRFFYDAGPQRMSHGYWVHLAARSRYHYGVLYAEARLPPLSLGANDAAHVAVQRRYALEELGYPVWGLSPSSTPGNDGYGEYGVRVLGSLGYGAGAVTPHAVALALGVAPAEAAAELRQLAARYDSYGEYGFYDAVDPRSGQVAHAYLALDQAMTFISAANYLKDGCIRRRFAADPIAARALAVIGDERFFE